MAILDQNIGMWVETIKCYQTLKSIFFLPKIYCKKTDNKHYSIFRSEYLHAATIYICFFSGKSVQEIALPFNPTFGFKQTSEKIQSLARLFFTCTYIMVITTQIVRLKMTKPFLECREFWTKILWMVQQQWIYLWRCKANIGGFLVNFIGCFLVDFYTW